MSKMIYVLVHTQGHYDEREETIEEAFFSKEKANEVEAELESMNNAYISACATFVPHTLDIPAIKRPTEFNLAQYNPRDTSPDEVMRHRFSHPDKEERKKAQKEWMLMKDCLNKRAEDYAKSPEFLAIKVEYEKEVAARAATIAAHDYLEMNRFIEHFVAENLEDFNHVVLQKYADRMHQWGKDNPAVVSLLWRRGYPLLEGYFSVVEVPLNE